MITLPEEFSKQISAFTPLFSKKVFEHAKVLITGSLLVVGRRMVCSALRAVGLSQERGFDKYHGVLSKAKWSCYQCAQTLLLLLVARFSQPAQALVFGIDETIERRWGPKIKAKGIYPVPIRWVLIKDPEGRIEPTALLSTKLDLAPFEIINFFIQRWTVEVTFEELRTHLGMETQRQWSDLAIARSTPALMALFSLITLWADQLHQQKLLLIKPCAWYQKSHPTFSDAIASVRHQIWRNQYFSTSLFGDDMHKFKSNELEHLVFMATRAA